MKNKIIVITGGATGMGFAMAKELIENNTVISIDRNPSKIASLKERLPKINSVQADLTLNDDLDNAVLSIEKSFGKIDVLINNAGKGRPFDFIHTNETELMNNIETEMAINYKTPILFTKKALPLLKKSSEPIVVISSSGLVYVPIAAIGGYCASKTAVHFITMSLRHQLAPLNIRVVEVLPPNVDTELNTAHNVKKMSPEKFAKLFLARLSKGENVINIGQSAMLERFSRLFPKLAFRMLNKAR